MYKPRIIYRKISNIRCTSVGNVIVDHCSNYIFILDLTPGLNELGKDNCKTRQETFKFWDLVQLILDILRYVEHSLHHCHHISDHHCLSTINTNHSPYHQHTITLPSYHHIVTDHHLSSIINTSPLKALSSSHHHHPFYHNAITDHRLLTIINTSLLTTFNNHHTINDHHLSTIVSILSLITLSSP